MSIVTYDPKQVTVLIGGFPIWGFAEGSFVKIVRSSNSFEKVQGCDGVVSRQRTSDFSGELTISLQQTSVSNDFLSALSIADEQSGAGVIPIIISDSLRSSVGSTLQNGTSGTTYVSAHAWIRKPADAGFSSDLSNREWVFDLADVDMLTLGTF